MTTQLTASEAHAMVLLNRADKWARGYRTTDGLQFVLFTGSTGQTYLSSESGCTCRGYFHRGRCAHQIAVKTDAERAREKAARRPRVRYEDLYDLEDSF